MVAVCVRDRDRERDRERDAPLPDLVRAVAHALELLRDGGHAERDARPRHALIRVVEVDVDGKPAGEEGGARGGAELVRVCARRGDVRDGGGDMRGVGGAAQKRSSSMPLRTRPSMFGVCTSGEGPAGETARW